MPTAVQEEFGITAAADAITAQKTPMEHAEHTLHHRISDERRAKRDHHRNSGNERVSGYERLSAVFFPDTAQTLSHFRGRTALLFPQKIFVRFLN
jgi:hypothetical protein